MVLPLVYGSLGQCADDETSLDTGLIYASVGYCADDEKS